MSEQVVREKLDLLFGLGIILAELEEEKAQVIDAAIPPEIKEHIQEIEAAIHTANTNYASVKAAVKDATLALGSTVKGANHMTAVWSKGRVTWDGKGLAGYMVAHPEVGAFRREGEPSVSIRRGK